MNASVVADDELRGPEDSNDRHECEDQDENDFAEWDCIRPRFEILTMS
jgi:hypothetical protein